MKEPHEIHNLQAQPDIWDIQAIARLCSAIAPDQKWKVTEESVTSLTVECDSVQISLKLTFD